MLISPNRASFNTTCNINEIISLTSYSLNTNTLQNKIDFSLAITLFPILIGRRNVNTIVLLSPRVAHFTHAKAVKALTLLDQPGE